MVDDCSLDCLRFVIGASAELVDFHDFGAVDVVAWVVGEEFSDGADVQFVCEEL